MATRTFHSFLLLPLELRLQIFDHASRAPRYISIIASNSGSTWKAITPIAPSPLFFVCQESRGLLLKTHHFLVGNEGGSKGVAFDGQKDVLVFRYKGFTLRCKVSNWLKMLPQEVVGSIKFAVWEAHHQPSGVYPDKYFDEEDLRVMEGLDNIGFAWFARGQDERVVDGFEEMEFGGVREAMGKRLTALERGWTWDMRRAVNDFETEEEGLYYYTDEEDDGRRLAVRFGRFVFKGNS